MSTLTKTDNQGDTPLMTDTKTILVNARQHLLDVGWIKGDRVRLSGPVAKPDGRVTPAQVEGCCILGAINHAINGSYDNISEHLITPRNADERNFHAAMEHLNFESQQFVDESDITGVPQSTMPSVIFNDTIAKSVDDVVELLDDAIKAL